LIELGICRCANRLFEEIGSNSQHFSKSSSYSVDMNIDTMLIYAHDAFGISNLSA